jgi:hypothetical protein
MKDFPVVEIVPKLGGGYVARYMERAVPRRIELSAELCEYDGRKRLFAVLHELGHWFRCEHLRNPGATSREEKFANLFALYFIEPGKLQKGDPLLAAEMKVLLGSGRKGRILGFARKQLRRLSEHERLAA